MGKKLQLKKIKYFFDQKFQLIYPLAAIKDVQATGEAFSLQKRKSNTSKHEIFIILGSDPDSESGPGSTDLIESGYATL
jgi:hypothetical protein